MTMPLPSFSWAWATPPAPSGDDEMALEPEDVAEPVDGGEGGAVPHAGDDAGFQVCLVHRGLLKSVGIERLAHSWVSLRRNDGEWGPSAG